MSEREPTAELAEALSGPGATARPWTEVVDVLTASEMFWLSTVRRDGRPHVTPLPAIWLDGSAALLHRLRRTEDEESRIGRPLHPHDRHERAPLRPRRRGRGHRRRVTDNAHSNGSRRCGSRSSTGTSRSATAIPGDPDGRHGLVFGVARRRSSRSARSRTARRVLPLPQRASVAFISSPCGVMLYAVTTTCAASTTAISVRQRQGPAGSDWHRFP